jgi:tetratricopeptide (TPR) repeat protein
MAYYEGETLKKKVERGPMKIEEAIQVASQVAEGLAKAHQQNIVHRDLKPANVMITKDGIAKIVDFGLAKLGGQTKLTKAGTTLGTTAYMSPEQARGEEVDHRTDVFSLGVLLYEMLTGRLPFKGDYDQAILYSIMNEDPEPLTGLRTGVPMELERIVHKCLQKDPSARYQHADELLVDLRALQEAQKSGISKTQVGTTGRAVPKKAPLIVAGLVSVIVLTIAGYLFFRKETAPTERIPIAVVDFVNETNEPELSGLSGMLITALEQSRRLDVMSRARMFDELKQMGKQDVSYVDETTGREIAKRANISALAVATIRKLDDLYTVDFKVIDPETGEHLFTAREEGEGQKSILGMIDRLSEKTRIDLKEQENLVQLASRGVADVTTTNLEAYQHFFLGEQLMSQIKNVEAKEEYRKAVALDSTFGLAWYRLAYATSFSVGSEALARVPLLKAFDLIDRIPEKEKYILRALKATVEGGYAAAIVILKEMENIYPNEKEMLYNIGDWAYHAEQYGTAAEYLNKVLAMDPTHERALMHLNMTYARTGEYQKARPVLEKLATVNQTEAYVQTGENHLDLGEYSAAIDYFKKAAELDSVDEQIPFDFWRAHMGAHNYAKAQEYARKMVSKHGSPFSYALLAATYALQGDLAQSLQTYQKGLRDFPGDHILQGDLGGFYAFQGEYAKAEGHFKTMIEGHQPERVQRVGFKGLAFFYPYLGKYSEMMRMFDKRIDFLLSDKDSNSVALTTASKAYWMFWGRGNKQEVLEEVKKVASFRNISSDNYYVTLASVYADIEDLENAETVARRAVRPIGKLRAEARIHAAKHEWQQAIDNYQKLNKLRPYDQPLYSYLAAQCHFEMGDFNKAIMEIEKSQGFFGYWHGFTYPLGFHLLGKIYEKKGDTQLAIDNYEKFLELWKDADEDLPDLIDAKARLAKLKGVAAN